MTIQHKPGERLFVVVFGPSEEVNQKLMRSAARTHGNHRVAVSAGTAVTYALVTFFVGGMLYYFGKRMRLEGRGRPGR